MAQSGLESFLNMSVGVGRLFGIPIKLHISLLFFLIPAFRMAPHMGAVHAIEIVIAIIISVLLHELGHALAAKAYKLSGLSITLHGFGGFAMSQGYRTPKQALIIVLMGPAVNFLLFGLGLAATLGGFILFDRGSVGYQQTEIVAYLAVFNLIMGIVNLVPMLPFDGGQVIAAVLSNRISPLAAQRRVAHLGLITGPICGLIGLGIGESMLTIFGVIGTLTSYAVLKQSGGIRFFEFLEDRRRRNEVAAQKRRENERHKRYLEEVEERRQRRNGG